MPDTISLIPGLGEIYGGKGNEGAAIIFVAVVIANLAVTVLPTIDAWVVERAGAQQYGSTDRPGVAHGE